MKKFLSVFMVCLLSFLLVGCGCDKDKDKDKNKEENKETKKIAETIKSLYTDDEKLVYDNGGVYKIVFFYSGNEITGLQHYYEYENEADAESKFKEYQENYKNYASIKNISKVDKFVVLTMASSEYEGKTVDNIKESYSFLKPVYEN